MHAVLPAVAIILSILAPAGWLTLVCLISRPREGEGQHDDADSRPDQMRLAA